MALFKKDTYDGWALKTDAYERTDFSHNELVDAINRVAVWNMGFLIVESLRSGAYMQAKGLGNGKVHLEIRVDKATGGFLLFASDGYDVNETADILRDFILGRAMPDLNDGWYVVFEK